MTSNTEYYNKILLVEDDADIQTIARLALEMVGGFTVHVCSDGAQALAEATGFAPDIILLDVMMPGMDGPTTLIELRKQPSLISTPVIFMTAKVQPSEIADYVKRGAIGVIAKPFDPMTLATQIKELWSNSR
jgi:two-component system OmpR family response regulator